MVVYAKKTLVTDPRFAGRVTSIYAIGKDEVVVNRIPVPDIVVLCNGCNNNISEQDVVGGEIPTGYLIYFSKRELNADCPYDIYCSECLSKYFPKSIKV